MKHGTVNALGSRRSLTAKVDEDMATAIAVTMIVRSKILVDLPRE
jgi:hypothetical protein